MVERRPHDNHATSVIDTITVGGAEAARLSGISLKTLQRYASAGEAVGLVKLDRRVLFHRVTLDRWLQSKIKTPVTAPTTN